MEITNTLKQKFVKDYNLPITIFENDLFDYYIKELDLQYNTIKKYELFKNFVNQYATQEEFMQASTKIIDNILEYVSNKENYKKLEQFRLAVLGKKQPKQRKKKKEKIKYCFNDQLTKK